MSPLRFTATVLGLTCLFTLQSTGVAAEDLPNLPPLSAEELALKDNPALPGAPAMILYYAVDTDNAKGTETQSMRLKVFRDEGKKYANIEIPYFSREMQVQGVRARTIGADGKVSEFTDQIYDREIVKYKKERMQAKVLTLPDVQVGTIIEYCYRLEFKEKLPDFIKNPQGYFFVEQYSYPAARWTVQQDLFVKTAHFALHKAGKTSYVLQHEVGLAPLQHRPGNNGAGLIWLDVENVPPYEEEEYSPPRDAMQARVDLYYAPVFYNASGYWQDLSKREAKRYAEFLKKSKVIEREATRLVTMADPEDTKLRKIYDRVQQIRAVSYEATKTDKERKQENLAENKNAEQVLTRGYAYANQINLLFIALARAAGFVAYPRLVTSRANTLFMDDWPSQSQLNAMVVEVRTAAGSIYLDPATKYCPYGFLPWQETEAGGIRVDDTSPTVGFTPRSNSSDAVIRRNAELRLTEDGALRGKVEMLYLGQEALNIRLQALQQDEAAKRKDLEHSLQQILAHGATVNLVSTEGWDSSDGAVKAYFEIDVPNYATPVGRRMVMPVGVFHVNQSNPFSSARRVNPIYFSYPQETHEDTRVEVPDGMKVEFLPDSQKVDQKAVYYEFSTATEGKTLRLHRTLRFSGYLFEVAQYANLRRFYQRVLAGDTQQATFVPRSESAAK